jgi:opacity protein-like surface antigen
VKKILLAAAALTGLSVSAFAADMPSRKAPAVAPVAAAPLWTGLYLGANAGYAFGKSSQRDASVAPADGDYHVDTSKNLWANQDLIDSIGRVAEERRHGRSIPGTF